jgi:hypothetical protein
VIQKGGKIVSFVDSNRRKHKKKIKIEREYLNND